MSRHGRRPVNVVLTGGTGFIGSRVLALLADHHQVISLQRRPPDHAIADVNYVVAEIDPTRPTDGPAGADSLERQLGAAKGAIDVIVHLAARISSGDLPTDLAGANVLGTLRLLELGAALGIRRFLLGSTGGVVGAGDGTTPIPESAPAAPGNAYGLTKHLAEQAVLVYRWPFEVVCLRYYYPYGRGTSNPMFCQLADAIADGRPVDVGSDGGPFLNPIHVDDATALTVRALGAQRVPRVINIAGRDRSSRAELARLIGRAIGREPELHYGSTPAPGQLADIATLTASLGSPAIGLAEGIAREFGPV